MALDTRNKRASAIGYDMPFLHVYPNPDGAITALDRQQIAWKYSGIAASPPTPGTRRVEWIIRARHRGHR